MKIKIVTVFSLFCTERVSAFSASVSVSTPSVSSSTPLSPFPSIAGSPVPPPAPIPLYFAQDVDENSSRQAVNSWFESFIDSTSYFQRDPNDASTCVIPAFNASIKLKGTELPLKYELEIHGANEEDFGMLCAKLFESQQSDDILQQKKINNQFLRQVVRNHFQNMKPHTGYEASQSSNYDLIDTILDNEKIESLVANGYVHFDTDILTTPVQFQNLSNILKSKTSQDNQIRSDTVTFINRNDAIQCDIEEQYNLLMGMADYLNRKLDWSRLDSGFAPLAPATKAAPLTNPANIQIASYALGEFYVAHSDNLLIQTSDGSGESLTRSNYRRFTVILYCSDDWNVQHDGGALRIYPNTVDFTDPSIAKQNNLPYEDVTPKNGKLLIFDSRLVHSVEHVLSSNKERLAMTIWISRPEDSGVSVDIWDEEAGKVDWYRMF